MADRPNDRVQSTPALPDELTPKIYLVVSGKKFIRPSLETYYAQAGTGTEGKSDSSCASHSIGAMVCTCNKVCTCNPQCSCQGHVACSCESYTSSSSDGGGTFCSCNQVCTCVPVY
jgi:hypothetical protein